MMRKALYLDGAAEPVEVVLDGPALRIRRYARADARAPIRLLGRIVVSGSVAWRTDALLACMDAGVPVVFVAADGAARGWAVGAQGTEEDINLLLEDACLDRDWKGHREDWIRGMERRSLIAAINGLKVHPASMRGPEAWAACEARVDALNAPVKAAAIAACLKGALSAHVAQLLRGQGIAGRFATGYGAPVRLLDDFTRILAWELWPLVWEAALYFCRHGVKHRTEADVRRRLIRFYEAQAPKMERRFADLFWRFRWHVREVLR
ncbi:MAG: CRISPR-associated endonuclease Cas1 [Rhodospirillales bacterium]|nr:CRISPR-associated endonuclease Cas1 [Rhodospirillales bacterium]